MHVCLPKQTMTIQTKFLRLRQPVPLGQRIEGWQVCWLGGGDRHHIFFLVMAKKVKRGTGCPS
jgi:hypothetical protein